MRLIVAAGAAALALVVPAVTAVPAVASSPYRAPIAGYKIGDPGVIYANGHWTVLATGSWSRQGTISTAPKPSGPWHLHAKHLLTARPRWASRHDHSVWAPSEIKIGDTYVVFYAAVIKGEKHKRCIGTGNAPNPTGPFTPRNHPISCIAGHGAPDSEPGVSGVNSTIDATPSYVTVNGHKKLFLTYKTQRKKADGHYYSAIQMVRLSIAHKARTTVHSTRRLTTRPDNIEENPVLVQRGKVFTLFTSLGGYTLCTYHTEWRQSHSLWNWPQRSHRLHFPAGTNTCGTGDAQVIHGTAKHTWKIFWSGRYPHRADSFKMYVGRVTWTNGTPEVHGVD